VKKVTVLITSLSVLKCSLLAYKTNYNKMFSALHTNIGQGWKWLEIIDAAV
jgi:hypothetical protein